MENEKIDIQNDELNGVPKIAKYRKVGWIATAILGVLAIGMLVAYVATGGTYGMEQVEETTAVVTKVIPYFAFC